MWPPDVKRIAALLRSAGVEGRLEEMPIDETSVPGPAVRAEAYDCDGRTVVALVPAERNLDRGKLQRTARQGRETVGHPEAELKAPKPQQPDQPLARARGFLPGRGEFCRRLGMHSEARAAYQRALSLARQEPERRFLERRLGELSN